MRRKWTIRAAQPDGSEVWTTVEVREGLVYVHRSAQMIVLSPEHMNRLLEVFREAQAVALYDRGRW